jgi:hypothetical protein
LKKILLFIIITSFTVLAFAQAGNVVVTSTSTSAYSYEGTGAGAQKLKMNVYILGRVNKPGYISSPR